MATSLLQQIAQPQIAQVGKQFRAGQLEGQKATLLKEQIARQGAEQEQRQGLAQSVGTSGFQSRLQQLAITQPDVAQKIQTAFQGIEENNLKSTFSNISIASGLPGVNQDQFLENAKINLSGRADLQAIIDRIIQTPPAQRQEAFDKFNEIGQSLGFIEAVDQAGKTPQQLQQELDIKQQVADTGVKAQETRASELTERQAETRRKAGELKPTMQKILDASQTQAFDAEKTANGFDLLSRDFDKLGFSGGVKASINDFLKDALGSQDEVSALRRTFRGIRASQATKNLPPGPASDKDIALALSGFPPENAPASVISSFIKGAAKIARIDQAFQTFKAEFISENKNTAGLIKAWKREKDNIIDDAIKNFEQGVTPETTIVVRSPTFGDVTEADITRTMADNNLTREQVLERLK